MKKLFIVTALLASSHLVQAQRQTTEDPTRYWGHFDLIKNSSKGVEHINVNYNITPKPIGNVLNLTMNTPNPIGLSVKIIDAAGKTKESWKPEQVSADYGKQFNIAGLQAGVYELAVYDASNNKVYSVPFTKQQSSSSN